MLFRSKEFSNGQVSMSENFTFLQPSQSDRPYTISEINEGVALAIESGNTLVWVEGEISNWKPSGSGHCYFKLKDAQSQIPSVMWRNCVEQLSFRPEDGMAVMAIASIRVYQKGGYYQLDIHRLQPIGSGALAAAFEKLKAKLEKEGLFETSRKRPLPQSIRRIGVVSSKHGAAIRDIVRVVASRAPQTDIILVDSAVQGEKAPLEIAAGIKLLNECGNVDCIIVGRGGGSVEDLWAFNDEIVARAIYESKIPVISAVGHEIDFTISDFVADVRAATPSAAAEIAVPDCEENRRYFEICSDRFSKLISGYFEDIDSRYKTALSRSALKRPAQMIFNGRQMNDDLQERCNKNFKFLFHKLTSRFSSACSRLDSLSPLSVFARGYSIVSLPDGNVIKQARQLSVNDEVIMKFCEGSAKGKILSIDD
jgi:exodeoxyribonuclease VII large subunit